MWGVTLSKSIQPYLVDVSIHAPRVGCDISPEAYSARLSVSIHAPRVGCDSALGYQEIEGRVSIHAPRVGCDLGLPFHGSSNLRFNSRTPCGV